MKLTGVSLFAGVGGFDLAMERNGVEVVANVEIDKQCQKVLAKHFPNAKQFSDITEVKGSDLIGAGFEPSRGIITGGFPCQDLSVAGKRAGLAGERSGLFWEIARLIEETKTEWFILENVPGLLTSNKGRDFGVVIGTLADLGYSFSWRVLDAQHFGVPQRRRRVFIVGRRTGDGLSPAEVLFKSEGLRRNTTQNSAKEKDVTSNTTGSTREAGWLTTNPGVTTTIIFYGNRVADLRLQDDKINTLQARMGTGGNNMPMVATTQVRRLTPLECERLQGFPDGWTEDQVDTHRYKQMGNAVAVPVVEWIIQGITDTI